MSPASNLRRGVRVPASAGTTLRLWRLSAINRIRVAALCHISAPERLSDSLRHSRDRLPLAYKQARRQIGPQKGTRALHGQTDWRSEAMRSAREGTRRRAFTGLWVAA